MSYEQKDNTGVFFNNNKKDSDKHPDFTGSILVEGIKKDVSIWKNKSKNGNDYYSMSFKDPYIKDEEF